MHISGLRPRRGVPLRRLLLMSLAFGVVPLLIVALVTSLLVRTVNQDFRSARHGALAGTEIATIQTRITEGGTAMTGALTASKNPGEKLVSYLKANASMAARFNELAAEVPASARPAIARAAAGWQLAYADFDRLSKQINGTTPTQQRMPVAALAIRIGNELVAPEQALEVASKATAAALTADLSRSQNRQRVVQNVLLVLALLGLAVVLWLSRRLNRVIVRPIDELKSAVERLDPETVERVELPRIPELAALAASFNAMADRLAASSHVIAENEARLSALFTHLSDMVLVLKADTTIVSATPSAMRLLGVPAEQLTGRAFQDFVAKGDRPLMLAALAAGTSNGPVEFRVLHADGRRLTTETHIVDLKAERAVQGIVLTIRDVSERKELEDLLSHQAFHDALTGLPNRALLRARLVHALKRSDATRSLALLYVDLDDFKTVNDSLGHPAGDELLQIVAARLQIHLRGGDTAARLGGDEFVILLEDADEAQALAAARRIRSALYAPARLAGIDVYPQGSIGVVVSTRSETSADEMLAHADAAMYLAKTQAASGICLYDKDLSTTVSRRLELKAELQRAVERSEIEVHYQPILDLKTGRMSGVEALARWLHPTIGLITPEHFIPLAEQTGLIVDIGQDVMNQACSQFATWRERFGDEAPDFLTVNVSSRQLREPALAQGVANALATYALRPGQLVLEITESVLFADDEPALERLRELKELGVQLAIDDFGTGYSSLAYLQRLPVDILKLDKHFVDELLGESVPTAIAVAKTIIDLGHHLGMGIIAEGIETASQTALLCREGCDFGQGYQLSRPMAAEQLSAQLAEWGPYGFSPAEGLTVTSA